MFDLFSVNTVAFTVFGYPLSYIELIGTLLYLWSVWLIARRNILTWPVGIVSVLLYMLLFYQIRLYSDTLEQVYYLGASIYGWWYWSRSPRTDGGVQEVGYSPLAKMALWVCVTAVFSLLAGALISQVHLLLPIFFPEPASFPYLDALTTVMSFTAMWLMARKRTESWVYWIIVDAIGIWLYYVKDVRFVALLYGILLALAIKGLVEWHRASRTVRVAAVVAA